MDFDVNSSKKSSSSCIKSHDFCKPFDVDKTCYHWFSKLLKQQTQTHPVYEDPHKP